MSLAQADKRVILVGGDLRRPEVHAYFGVPNDRGLVQVLDGGDEPPLVMTGVPNLRLLPSGPPVEMSAQLFEGGAFPELVDRLREAADLVIIDAPPLAISDPLVMAEHADGILIVVDMKQADKSGLRRVRELLERAGLSPLGTHPQQVRGRVVPQVRRLRGVLLALSRRRWRRGSGQDVQARCQGCRGRAEARP